MTVTQSETTRPTVHGFDLSPLHKYFMSQLAEPGEPNGDQPANDFARRRHAPKPAEVPQWRQALALSVEAKRRHREVLVDLTAGGMELAQALRDERIATVRVKRVLLAQRGWGPKKVSRLMMRCHLSDIKRCGELTERQITFLDVLSR